MHPVFFGRNPRLTLARIAALVVVALVAFRYVLLPVRMTGISMLPTYQDGSFNFANRLAYLTHEPERGDIVAIRMAGEGVVYVKRIVGLPGEQVEIVDGIVRINGRPLVEPAVVRRAPWNMRRETLGDREYFLIGDNRSMPIEAHGLGRARRERIVGKLIF